MIITTSWDDGAPDDLRLADMLARHGIAGTFYVPCRNQEGRPVMNAGALRHVAQGFEIAAHTIDHVDLTAVPVDEADRQIRDGRRSLEETLGTAVRGFCYPRGRQTRTIRRLVAAAGFDYARTVRNFRTEVGGDPFAMPVTLQLFPHRPTAYLRNLIKYGLSPQRLRLGLAALATPNLVDRVARLVDICAHSGGVFHLWGHSWEIEEQGLWPTLDQILSHLARSVPRAAFASNYQVLEREQGAAISNFRID